MIMLVLLIGPLHQWLAETVMALMGLQDKLLATITCVLKQLRPNHGLISRIREQMKWRTSLFVVTVKRRLCRLLSPHFFGITHEDLLLCRLLSPHFFLAPCQETKHVPRMQSGMNKTKVYLLLWPVE